MTSLFSRAAVLTAWIALAASCGRAVAAADPATPSVLVTTAPLQAGSLPQTITVWGTLLAPPAATQVVSAGAAQIVSAVHVRAGEEVRAGAPLVALRPDAQTAASYSVAQAALRDAETTLARTRDLLTQHLATAQQLGAAQKARGDAQAALRALQAQGAAGATVLRAPAAAIVTQVSAVQGARVAPGTALVELAPAGQLTLRVGATPAQARRVQPGDAVAVRPLGGTEPLAGQVASRSASVASNGLVPIAVTLPANPLFAGESAEAVITVGHAQGYVVPHAAILLDPAGQTYVVQVAAGKARTVPVQVAASVGDRDVIRGAALRPAEPLVLDGNYQLADGIAVRLAQPPASAGADGKTGGKGNAGMDKSTGANDASTSTP